MVETSETSEAHASDIANDAAGAKLTVVVPVYNRAELVGRTLDSIAAQTLRPLNVILVDNASTDASKAVMHKWKSEHNEVGGLSVKLLDESAVGACAARNRGLAEVATPWVMFFDSDDIMAPEHCARAIEAADTHPMAKIIGWDVLYGKDGGPWKLLTFRNRDLGYNNMFNSNFATQRYMCRTELIRAVGGWSTDIEVWNDIELGARIALRKPRCYKIKAKEPTVHIFITEGSLTGGCFAAKPDKKTNTLKRMRKYAPSAWVNLKGVILSAHCELSGTASGRLLKETFILQEKSKIRRRMLSFAYHYTVRGHRGIARILRPFMPSKLK